MKLEDFLEAGFHHAPPRSPFDWLSPGGRWGIVAQDQVAGTRELHSLLLKIAIALNEAKEVASPSNACLVFAHPALSPPRLAAEWERATRVLDLRVSSRIGFLSPLVHCGAILPDEPWAEHLRGAIQAVPFEQADEARDEPVPPLTEKSFEVLKVILSHWLRSSSPLPIGRIGELTGFSYPTVSRTLRRLRSYNEIRQASDRSVILNGFPYRSWGEAVVMARSLRQSFYYRDASGRPPDPYYLLERIERSKPQDLALGGTEGARFFDPSFDLNGVPRIDLTWHDPSGKRRPDSLVQSIDPAMKLASMPGSNAVLAIHSLRRRDPLFISRAKSLPISDPTEILLDLAELRLSTQADELLHKLFERKAHGEA